MTQVNSLNWTVAEETPVIAPFDSGMQMTGKDITIGDLVERCQAYDAHKQDFAVPATSTSFDSEGNFHVAGSEASYSMDDWALRQSCERFGKASDYNRTIPTDYARYLINYQPQNWSPIWGEHAAKYKKDLFIRTYGGNTVRGVLSDRFTHIDNKDLLGAVQQFVESGKVSKVDLVRPYVGISGMNVRITFGNILPEGGKDGGYGLGVVVRNGEIGNISPSVQPFFQRTSCTNSTVWKEGGITLKQSGNNREYRLHLLIAAIGEALGASGKMVQTMMEARQKELPNIDTLIARMAEQFDWGTELVMAIGAGTEKQATLAGLVNGVTYAAHAVPMTAEKAYELEALGGQLLYAKYETLNRR
jgi:hypothetical protein